VETGVPPNGPPLEAAWYSYTVYWVTGRPLAAVPLTGVQETVMARVAVGSGTAAPAAVGAAIVSGLPNGIAVTPSDQGALPRALRARTVNVYWVPSVRPVNVCDVVTPTAVICCPPDGGGLTSTS